MISFSFILLLIAAFFAGFIDAVVGGGGLVQLPAVMFYMPESSLISAFGTNKFASFFGTFWASIRYSIKIHTNIIKNIYAIIPAVLMALPFSYLGAETVEHLNKETLKPIIVVLFSGVAIYTFIKKDFGLNEPKHHSKTKTILISLFTGAIIGFYDGFFGPGTGSFLVFIYVFLFGFEFLLASAFAKIVNTCTNLAALISFISKGEVSFELAIPIAIFNIAGSILGARMAIKKGSSFIRIAFLFVITAFIIKMLYDILYRK